MEEHDHGAASTATSIGAAGEASREAADLFLSHAALLIKFLAEFTDHTCKATIEISQVASYRKPYLDGLLAQDPVLKKGENSDESRLHYGLLIQRHEGSLLN